MAENLRLTPVLYHLSSVGPKQLCALVHLGCTCEAGTSWLDIFLTVTFFSIHALSKYKLVTEFSEDEFAHWFMPRKNIIDTFVVEKDGKVTDMVSFYTLPSTVMSHPTHDRYF